MTTKRTTRVMLEAIAARDLATTPDQLAGHRPRAVALRDRRVLIQELDKLRSECAELRALLIERNTTPLTEATPCTLTN